MLKKPSYIFEDKYSCPECTGLGSVHKYIELDKKGNSRFLFYEFHCDKCDRYYEFKCKNRKYQFTPITAPKN